MLNNGSITKFLLDTTNTVAKVSVTIRQCAFRNCEVYASTSFTTGYYAQALPSGSVAPSATIMIRYFNEHR